MNIIGKAFVISILFTICTGKKLYAQFVPSNYEIGINFGTLVYQGDLAVSNLGYTKSLKPSVGVFVSKSLSEYFSFRANLNIGKIGADDLKYTTPDYKQHRALNFTTPVSEVSANLVWNIFGNSFGSDRRRLSPYLFVGAGLAFVNITRNWNSFDTAYFGGSKSAVNIGLNVDTLQKTPRVLPILPVGAGLKYMITPQLYLNAEATYRIMSSDYLDGFSHVANTKNSDYYYGITIGISYKFGNNRYDCPKLVR